MNATASSRVYGDGMGSQRWLSGSWLERSTSSTSSWRGGRSTSRAVRSISVGRSTPLKSTAGGSGVMASGVAEDAVDGDLDDHARRVDPRLSVALGIAALGLGDGPVVVADDGLALERHPAASLDLADG